MNTSIYMNLISGGLIIFILILVFAIYWQVKTKRTEQYEKSKIGKFSRIIKNAPFCIYFQKISFTKEGKRSKKMIIWNKEMTKLFGQRSNSIADLLEEPCKIQFEKARDSALKGFSDITKNFRFKTLKGKDFDGFTQLQLVIIDDYYYILGVIINISELKSAINNGIANYEEEKTFLANISNEICTPINAVLGLTQLLSKEKDIKTINHYGKLINKKGKDLRHMITDVLILSKLEKGELQPKKTTMFIQDVVRKLADDSRALIKASDKKTFNYCLPYETVKQTFSYELQGFIHNHLLYNAVKFSTKGKIECGMLFEDEKQIMYAYNSFFKPIPEENCIDAFYRFTKLNMFIQGTGIGLTISRMITEYLGGSIGFNGDINNGVLIWVELPSTYSCTGKDEKEVKRIQKFLEARWEGIWFDEKGTLHKPKKKGIRI